RRQGERIADHASGDRCRLPRGKRPAAARGRVPQPARLTRNSARREGYVATYKIHPGIGIARLGNSTTEFYIAPETPAGLPQACDPNGNPRHGANGVTPVLVTTFRDAEGRIKRQAARFQVFVYDQDSPEGRPLKIGDRVAGGGNEGTLIEIQ